MGMATCMHTAEYKNQTYFLLATWMDINSRENCVCVIWNINKKDDEIQAKSQCWLLILDSVVRLMVTRFGVLVDQTLPL